MNYGGIRQRILLGFDPLFAGAGIWQKSPETHLDVKKRWNLHFLVPRTLYAVYMHEMTRRTPQLETWGGFCNFFPTLDARHVYCWVVTVLHTLRRTQCPIAREASSGNAGGV